MTPANNAPLTLKPSKPPAQSDRISSDVLRAIQTCSTVFVQDDEDEDDEGMYPWLIRDEMDLEDTADAMLGLERVKSVARADGSRYAVGWRR